MRPLAHSMAFAYGGTPSLAGLGLIEITNASPAFAAALAAAIEGFGGTVRVVPEPGAAGICLLTEGLAGGVPAERDAACLQALIAGIGNGARTYALDLASADDLANIGGCAGLCRTLRIEQPEAASFALSLNDFTTPDDAAVRVAQALVQPAADYILGQDAGWIATPGAALAPPALHAALPDAPVWLVTGGARGVTADCTVELARRTGGTFLLLGRSDLTPWPEWLAPETELKVLRGALARNASRPDVPGKPVEIDRMARRLLAGAEISATLAAIEAAGARAHYLQADIGNITDVQRVLAGAQQAHGAITGLVHGAGVLADGLAQTLDAGAFAKVYGPKVDGLNAVLSALDVRQLRHIGLFSSASAVFGNQGQANYAAANAWLNNVAGYLCRCLPDAQVKAFCWGPWAGGMVDESLARMFTERGIGLISRPEGARIFADMLLGSPPEQTCFVIGDEWGAA